MNHFPPDIVLKASGGCRASGRCNKFWLYLADIYRNLIIKCRYAPLLGRTNRTGAWTAVQNLHMMSNNQQILWLIPVIVIDVQQSVCYSFLYIKTVYIQKMMYKVELISQGNSPSSPFNDWEDNRNKTRQVVVVIKVITYLIYFSNLRDSP